MKKLLSALLLYATACSAEPPKLVLGIVVDQFRYDYLTRFRKDYHGGLARLLERGAVFTNARYQHSPTVTAAGHSVFLTGAMPAVSGIVGNEWYERETGTKVASITDDTVQLLGAAGKGASPARLLVSTVGDELKIAGKGGKVIGISVKDRAAILPAGHMADGAYWLDAASGNFVSSTFYFKELPGWVSKFNGSRAIEKYLGAEWVATDDAKHSFRKLPAEAGPKYYDAVEATPYGDDFIEAFAERTIDAEQLGRHAGTDLLTVSFSPNDYIGHVSGPDSAEVRDVSLRTDLVFAKLFGYIDSHVGAGNTLVIFTADHGVSPVPEVNRARRMPGGRLSEKPLLETLETKLREQFGAGQWVTASTEGAIYLNRDLMRERKLDEATVERAGAGALRGLAHVSRVYTREQLLNGQALTDEVSRRVANGFYDSRSGNLFVIPEPYWIFSARGTSHGTPFGYDAHVPVIFMGPGIKPGQYHGSIAVNDIAPTLATLLEVEIPSGSVGRVLEEIFARR